MATLLAAPPPQTLYVTVLRDELRQLKNDNALLQQKVAHLTSLLQTSIQHEATPTIRRIN